MLSHRQKRLQQTNRRTNRQTNNFLDMKKLFLYIVMIAAAIIVVSAAIYSHMSFSDEHTMKNIVIEEISRRMDELDDGPMAVVISHDGDKETYLVTLEDGKVIVKDSNKDTVAYAFDVEMFSK